MLKLIDFYADWCGPCKIMKPIFNDVEPEFEGEIEFAEVDVEENNEKAQEFNVMSIPTFVIMEGDKEIDRRMRAMPKEALVDWLNSHLE